MTEPRIETIVRVTAPDGAQTTMVSSNVPVVQGVSAGNVEVPALSYADAAELTARIGQALGHAESLIVEAFVGRAWQAMGYSSWDEWVDAHFGSSPLMTVARLDRPVVVQALSTAGMSTRAIGRALGVGRSTVHRELAGVPDGTPGEDAATVVGRDGKVYPRQPAAPKPAEATAEACVLCGGVHAVEHCPDLDKADDALFGPIELSADELDAGMRFGPGVASSDDQGDDDETEELLDGDEIDVATDDVADDAADGPAEPVPAEVARRRVGRLRRSIARVTVTRDDLDELAGVVASIRNDLDGWPDPAVRPPDVLVGELTAAIEGIERQRSALTRVLSDARAALGLLGAVAR